MDGEFAPRAIRAGEAASVRNAAGRGPPELFSARRLVTWPQALILGAAIAGMAAGIAYAPRTLGIAVNIALTAYFIAVIAFRMRLTLAGYLAAQSSEAGDSEASAPGAPPIVTILLPLMDEADSLPTLFRALNALDYPRERLDIKILLEARDEATLAAAQDLRLDALSEILIVPAGGPRTKPNACNFGLRRACGELIVIYDAEDIPDSDQLAKAARRFARSDPRLACLQARLRFYNADENWLTRLFALEYGLWFDCVLPALQRFGLPIPLGGTSNIFRTRTLVELGGWDPYNVTEDADLGLRLARCGYRTEMLDSTTLEEANCQTGNWLRQRSRWMKGYMQTWLVHMREPLALQQALGWRGFCAMQLLIGGTLLSALVNPALWAVFALWLSTQAGFIPSLFPEPLLTLNLLAFLIGNSLFAWFGVLAALKQNRPELAAGALLAPAYWALASAAAWRALVELPFRRHHWEKTRHFLSAEARARRAEALRALRS